MDTAPTEDALPGGVVIELPEARRVLFGRAPRPVHEGALPLAQKWQHVREGLARLRDGEAWDLCDARFDRARFVRREGDGGEPR